MNPDGCTHLGASDCALLFHGRMIHVVAASVVLSVYSLLHPVAFTALGADCRELPQNIRVEADLRPRVTQLFAQSRTLRAQCTRIAAARATHVTISLSVAPLEGGARARSIARRYPSGLLIVEVQLPAASRDFVELLAHELEHVVELIDGIDFRTAARGGSAVYVTRDGSFESDRARAAGIAAAAEAVTEEGRGFSPALTEPLTTAGGAASRIARAAARFARAAFKR